MSEIRTAGDFGIKLHCKETLDFDDKGRPHIIVQEAPA